MWKNYLKTAFRNLQKDKLLSFINVTGLAIGLACCLLIVLFVRDELSYDSYPEASERIYRVVPEINFGGNHSFYAVAPAPMGPTLEQEYPEVEKATRLRNWGDWLVRPEGTAENIKEEKVAFADSNFLQFFTIPIISGEPDRVLKAPNTVAISASAAQRHFGTENPVGETIVMDDEYRYEVTAVFEDIPKNAHFHLDFLLAMSGYEDSRSPVWLSNNYHTYIRLQEGTDSEAFEDKLPALFKKYAGPQVMQLLDKTIEEVEASGQGVFYTLQPLESIHLNSDRVAELEANGDVKYVYIFSSIALFILLIACINFMNLSTARSANRAKEVGVRKTMGAERSHLIRQFLTESVLMSLLAVVLAAGVAKLIEPLFNNLVGKDLVVPVTHPVFLGIMLLGALLVGLLAGSYPSFYLSSFMPVDTLQGRIRNALRGGALRNGLVVFQFVISIFLIIGTLAIDRQVSYIRSKKLGFDREQVLLLHDAYALDRQARSFKERMEGLPQVQSASFSSYLPVRSSRSDLTMWPEGKMTETNSVSTQYWRVDEDYIPTMGMKLVAGRNFSREMPTDSSGIVINQRAAQLFGFEDPIGKRISTFADFDPTNQQVVTYTILGVIEDFHYESLRTNVNALGMILAPSRSYLAIRYSGDPAPLIRQLESNWKEMAPGQPLAYSFMDERFDSMYEAEQRTGSIFLIFAGLAIFVACLGLFALATFTAERRTKEIGIRKVMGASVSNIFMLLSSEFTKWVLLAYLIAVPLGWYFARQWLQDFEYQASLSLWIFVVAAFVALAIALLTVSYQAIRAAVRNPVEALRYE